MPDADVRDPWRHAATLRVEPAHRRGAPPTRARGRTTRDDHGGNAPEPVRLARVLWAAPLRRDGRTSPSARPDRARRAARTRGHAARPSRPLLPRSRGGSRRASPTDRRTPRASRSTAARSARRGTPRRRRRCTARGHPGSRRRSWGARPETRRTAFRTRRARGATSWRTRARTPAARRRRSAPNVHLPTRPDTVDDARVRRESMARAYPRSRRGERRNTSRPRELSVQS